MITQDDYNVTKQLFRNLFVKIYLLNYNYQVVDELSGNVISGAVRIDANSDIRRTCTISLVITDNSFEVEAGGKIFLDKYIKIETGIDNIFTGNINWVNQGIFLIDKPSYKYDSTTNTLSFSGLDLMSKLTGIRNGYLEGLPTIIPKDSNVREAMISSVTQLGKFKNYSISECMNKDVIQPVPYDIKIEQGGTVFSLIKELRDIIPNYQVYFDTNGVFYYNLIPSSLQDAVLIDDDIWKDVVISEDINVDFESVKNSIEVYGANLNPAHYNVATVSGASYIVSYSSVSSLTDKMLYGFTAPSIIINPSLKVNSLAAFPIVNEDETVAIIPKENTYYIVQWKSSINKFIFIGYQQPYAIAKDLNEESPFYVNSNIGEIRLPLYGGEYDKIQTNSLVQQRANWELWQRTQLQESITLTCVPIYWLDVNMVVSYTKKDTDIPIKYIIKNIDTNLSFDGTQTINMIKLYDYYD